MKEEYLHYLFKTKQLGDAFMTTDGQVVKVLNFGCHNQNAGPDFLECKIQLDDKIWAGQIEFHVNSSDWLKHKHQHDVNYNNVILHFVVNHDKPIFSGKYLLPTVTLKDRIDNNHYQHYLQFVTSKNWIACQNELGQVDNFVIFQQKEKALINRLRRKSDLVLDLIRTYNGDRKKVFYLLLFKAFGTKVNQEPFFKLGERFDSKIIAKINHDPLKIEAYIFGLAGFLNEDLNDPYYNKLKQEYVYLKRLFTLNELDRIEWKFSTMRPQNFPTVRLAQLSNLLTKEVFKTDIGDIKTVRNDFKVNLNAYWQSHYDFQKVGKKKTPNLTENFIDLLLINVVIPFYFAMARLEDDEVRKEKYLEGYESIKSEKNSILSKWKSLGVTLNTAFDSQALIEQKNEFCNHSKCLNCKIGQHLLR
ncbi:MAG: DUF2851 family protein [Putridiphycobacter sp.]